MASALSIITGGIQQEIVCPKCANARYATVIRAKKLLSMVASKLVIRGWLGNACTKFRYRT